MPRAQRIHVIVNPVARRASSAIAELVRQCRASDIASPIVLATTRTQPGSVQARQALDVGADLVIVIGGDGTIRQVARELARGQGRLGVIALGSGNVLAHNLGVAGQELSDQVEIALGQWCAELDLGRAELQTTTGLVHSEPFCTMIGIGRDAQSVAATGLGAKKRWGWGAYALAGLQHALLPPLPMSVQLDDEPERHLATWTVLGGITPRAPGGVVVFPDARADDGLFSVLEVPIKHPGQWLPVAIKGLLASGLETGALRYHRARTLRVCTTRPLPVQLDGDVIEEVVELRASIQPRALRVQVAKPKGA